MSDFLDRVDLASLHAYWHKAKANKSNSLRIQRFENNALDYLVKIQLQLRDRLYRFGPYKTFTVTEKKRRDVVDAPTKDRIIHWLLYRYMLPIWQPRFINDTYGNLPGRGSHRAIKRVADFARRPDNKWVLQLDISKYFYSVPHAQLKAKALRYIGDEDIRRLIITLIDSYRTGHDYDHLFDAGSDYRLTEAKGMPIGNLPSQLFANIYLCAFDHWVKESLQVRCYVRYVDDIVIFGESREQLQDICELVKARLASEGLTIHPHKIRLAPITAGIPFLGYIAWPAHVSAGRRIRSRYHRTLRQHESGIYDRSSALQSYQSMMAHTGSTL